MGVERLAQHALMAESGLNRRSARPAAGLWHTHMDRYREGASGVTKAAGRGYLAMYTVFAESPPVIGLGKRTT